MSEEKVSAQGTETAVAKSQHAQPVPAGAVIATSAPAGTTLTQPLPGLEVVGRGIHLRPYQPYSLGSVLFKRTESRVVSSKETKAEYSLPEGYEVNDSPPFPMNESLNQVVIEESWDRFETTMGLDANASVSGGNFSVSATSSWNSSLRAESEAYYAVRSSFVPLWMLYVPDPSDCLACVRDPDVPSPFAPEHRQKYEEFFRSYGSHYVRGAWVGGKSMLVFTVLKSSEINKEQIQAGIKASFGGVSGDVSSKETKEKERLRNSSQCTVIGKGGDEVLLAAMSSLDQDAYNQWLKTIPDNPQVIELDVAGIWTLIRDPAKALAIKDAYRESVSFEPIKAVVDIGQDLYFIRGAKFVRYDREKKITHPPAPMREFLPGLEELGFERIDEAFRGKYLRSPEGEPLDDKIYVIRRNRVLRFDIKTRTKDPGYPMELSEAFPGIPFDRVDAVLVTGFDSIYFFYGKQYARFNPITNKTDEGYPQAVAKRWVGVTFDRINAAVYWGDSKVYFFKGDQHIRYDLANYRSDPGYPQHVIGNYIDDWKFIDN